MRRIGVLAVGFLGSLLLAAWLGPGWMDAGRFRATLEEISSAALGQAVHIQGDLAFTLLPTPRLTATRASLGDASAVWPITADELRLRVAILPLLAGRIEARDLVLRGAEINLPWPLPADLAEIKLPAWTTGFAARIERSRLVLGPHEWRDIDATLATTEAGTLNISGTGKQAGREARFTARLGARGRDGSASLDASLDGRGPLAGAGLTITGHIGADASFIGSLNIRAADLSLWLPTPAVAARAQGPFRFARGSLSAGDLAVDLPSGPARVSLVADWHDVPRLSLQVAAARLDLDPWVTPLRRLRQPDMPVHLNLDIGAASFGGGLLRQFRADLTWQDGMLRLRAGNATLPGDATLVLTGQIAPSATAPLFHGDTKLTAPDLRATLRWLETVAGPIFPSLPDGVLRSADLTARLQIGTGLLQATDLVGSLDEAALTGSFTLRPDQNPAIVASLSYEQLRLDPWLPHGVLSLPDLARRLAGPTMELYLTAGELHLTAGELHLTAGELRLAAGAAALGGHAISQFRLDVARTSGAVQVRRLEGVLDGVMAIASANLADDGKLSDGRLDLSADDATPLAQWLPRSWRATPSFWNGRLALKLEGGGPQEALSLRVQGEIGDLRIDAQPVWDLPNGRAAGRLHLRHPGAPRLLAELGLTAPTSAGEAPSWPGAGSLSAQVQGTITPQRINLEKFELTAGDLRASGQLALDWSAAEPVLGGRIMAETLPLPWPPPVLSAAGSPPTGQGIFPLVRQARATVQLRAEQTLVDHVAIANQLACTIGLADRIVRLHPCAAQVAHGVAKLDAQWDLTTDPPRVSLDGALEGARLEMTAIDTPGSGFPLDVAATQVDGTLSLSATGHSHVALRATADGRLELRLRDAAVAGVDLPAISRALDQATDRPASTTEAALRAALGAGTTPFTQIDMTADVARGGLTLRRASATGPAGSAMLVGTLGLLDGTLDLLLTLQPPDRTLPDATLHVSGPGGAPTRAQDISRILRWLADRPR